MLICRDNRFHEQRDVKNLTSNEDTIRPAVLCLREEAHGPAILRQIRDATGRGFMYSTLHTIC